MHSFCTAIRKGLFFSGVSTKIELTETVEESSLKELIKNDLEECGYLARKLPPAKKDWEHVRDVHLQVFVSEVPYHM